MRFMAKRKAVPGDVCELALGDGRFAYGRVLREASIAVYRSTTETSNAPPLGERDFLFTVRVYDDVPGSAECPVVGQDPFDDEDQARPPPYKVVDPINGRIRIYYRGELQDPKDPIGAEQLEKAAVWDLHHLVDRIRSELSP